MHLYYISESYLPSYLCFLRICQTLASPVFTARSGNFWASLQAQGIIVSQLNIRHGSTPGLLLLGLLKNGWNTLIILRMHLPCYCDVSCYWLLRCFCNLKFEEVQWGSTLTTWVSSDWILTVPATQTLVFDWSEPRILEHKVLVPTKPILFRNLTTKSMHLPSFQIVSMTAPPPSASSPPQSLQPVDPWMTCAQGTQVCKIWNRASSKTLERWKCNLEWCSVLFSGGLK